MQIDETLRLCRYAVSARVNGVEYTILATDDLKEAEEAYDDAVRLAREQAGNGGGSVFLFDCDENVFKRTNLNPDLDEDL